MPPDNEVMTDVKERTVHWLRMNSKAMRTYKTERECMHTPEYYPLEFTDEQIWSRYLSDSAMGLVNDYFRGAW